ncbi:MAG TPA: glycerol kinase GlpK [Gemmatimonadales bacterium]|nr:glycerol kinase GlpK [Gemmatimonadales bacterium]
MPSILALDQGTTGSRAIVLDQGGTILGSGYREFPQHFPTPGWVEHDAEEIWNSTLVAAREALGGSDEVPNAIGITNQRETVVVWDRKTGRPLHRALVWQDRRTAERCRSLHAEYGDAWLGERTGLIWDPYFSGTKIEWLLDQVPDLRRRAEAGEAVFGTVDSWLVYRLTGGRVHVTDHTNASRTLLYDLRTRDWSDELLGLFGVPRASLPDIRRSSEVVGTTDPALLGHEIPIAGIAGDQQAALFGQGCFAPGQAKCTYGTGAFLLMHVGGGGQERQQAQTRQEVLTTIACDERGGPAYALEGSIFIAGAAVQWLRDGLELIARASETEAIAKSVADTGGVYFVPALVGLGAPYWESGARGTMVGLTRGTTSAHLVRAALEAMAYSTKDVMDAMVRASGVPLKELRADGGASANDWLMGFQATTLGVTVRRPDVVETTALGAAALAGLAVGVWPDVQTFTKTRTYTTFEPARTADPAGYAGWKRAVDAALYWAKHADERSSD